MKKLMITFSAALIAGICAADISSSNVVGYDSVGLLNSGYAKGVGVSFLHVDNSDVKLRDLVVRNYEDGEDTGVSCQFLDGNGRTIGNMTYYWFDFEEDGDTYYGWWDGKLTKDYSEIKELLPGESVWMYSDSNKCNVTFKSPIQKEVE